MNIAGTDYDLNNKALSIYISGCDGTCIGCHNEQLWDYDIGVHYREYFSKIEMYLNTDIVDNVWIMGGEPLLQDKTDFLNFLDFLKPFNKCLWLWTRFEIEDIDESIMSNFSFIKTGKYIKDRPSYKESLFGITLASTNQKIIKTP